MAIMWRPQPREVYQSWINALRDEASEKLTSWEEEFIESLHDRMFKYNKDLSEKQAEILERIYAEKTS